MNILLTSFGSVSSDAVVKKLNKKLCKINDIETEINIIACDINYKECFINAYSIKNFYQVPLVKDEEKFFDSIKSICEKEKINYIFPLSDVDIDFFNNHREYFYEKNIVICMSNENVINIIRDKKVLQDYLQSEFKKIRFIPTEKLIDLDKPLWNYPIVLKPYNGRSSQKLHYVNNYEEFNYLKSQENSDIYIVEPFISGERIVVDIVRNEKTNKIVAIPRREILSTANGLGLSVLTFRDSIFEEECKIIAEKLNVKGCVNFEFIKNDDGNYYFLECNPRFSGGIEFSCIAGYDYIFNHLKCFCNMEIDDLEYKNNLIITRKYEEYITKIFDGFTDGHSEIN